MAKELTASEQALRDRESELAEVQRIAKVGGVIVDLRDGFQNRRSPEYLAIHGLPLKLQTRHMKTGSPGFIRTTGSALSGNFWTF